MDEMKINVVVKWLNCRLCMHTMCILIEINVRGECELEIDS